MIRLSIIYALLTIGPLAFIDVWRIKKAWAKKENIDHEVSMLLAYIGLIVALVINCGVPGPQNFCRQTFILTFLTLGMALFIRLSFYDTALNLWRILFKINPTMRLDYESKTTSSWVDQHLRLSFWQKRGLAVVGYAVVIFVYYKIF